MTPCNSTMGPSSSFAIAPRAFLFCRTPTGTHVTRIAMAIGLLLTTAACSFKNYDYANNSTATGGASSQESVTGGASSQPLTATGGTISQPAMTGGTTSQLCPDDSGLLCVPACTDVPSEDNGFSASPVAHWTFDQPNSDTSKGLTLYDESDTYALSLHPDTSAPHEGELIRINGQGTSIYLDGHNYYAADGSAQVPSIQNGGTIAALISLSHDTLPTPDAGAATIWPIISTISTNDNCSGYQLDIRIDADKGLEIAFSYAYDSPDASSDCKTASLALPVNRPSWAWNTGHWHHVAATYMPQGHQARVALYWDSDSPSAKISDVAWFDGRMPEYVSTLYVGTNANEANDSSHQRFKGNIDEISIFNSPLEQIELAQFSVKATTVAGPSGCRWQATESHQDGVDAGVSTAQLGDHDTNHVQVQIHDEDWGAGAVAARLASPGTGKNLTRYSAILLTADGMNAADTPNGAFEFSLSAGDDSCTWYVAANRTNTNTYRIDLGNPDYCQSTSCQFAIKNVEWAAIRSIWEYPPSLATKATNQLGYAINRLDLAMGGSPIDPTRYGGVPGPNNWCWRTQAFQAKFDAKSSFDADAGLANSGSNDKALHAILSGNKASGSAIVADFGDDTLDLSTCSVVLDATLDPPENMPDPAYPALILQDSSGSWAQWTWDGTPVTSSDAHNQEPYAGIWPWQPYLYFPRFDRSKVTLLAIQKTWQWNGTANLTVNGVRFVDNNGNGNCEIVNHH